MAPTPISTSLAQAKRDEILEAIMCVTTYLHSSNTVVEYARMVFGKETVEKATEDRKEEEKAVMDMNGHTGEGPANRASARVYCLLMDAEEGINAEVWKRVIVPVHFTEEDFQKEIENVQAGL